MSATRFRKVVQHIHRMAASAPRLELTDQELLGAFASAGDGQAFATLVVRHGPMVFRICQRTLHHDQDAEDAFQAVFLVLLRSARSIRKQKSVASWLHGVALRIARKAKRDSVRRHKHESAVRARSTATVSSPLWSDVQAVLDEEIQKLPATLQSAFVLCVLEGKTGQEAARELAIPAGTVSRRLSEARKILRQRLARRGIELSTLLAALAIADNASLAMPSACAAGINTLIRYATTSESVLPNAISPTAFKLAGRFGRHLALHKLKLLTGWILALTVLCSGAGLLSGRILWNPASESEQVQTKVPTMAAKHTPVVRPDANMPDSVVYSGRAIGPGGKAISGAKVYYHFHTSQAEPTPVRATTGVDGRFKFTLHSKQIPESGGVKNPLRCGLLIVKADGYSYAWNMLRDEPEVVQEKSFVFRLLPDNSPIQGSFVDLEGRPLPGLRISVLSAAAPTAGELSPFVKAMADRDAIHESIWKHAPNYLVNIHTGSSMAEFLPTAVTDEQGKFVLSGFANEQVLELRIEGDPIESQTIAVLHCVKLANSPPMFSRPRWKNSLGDEGNLAVLWNEFRHPLPPGLAVGGLVRDEKTGRPIARAVIESYQLAGSLLGENAIYRTVADDQGRYRLSGLPRGKGNQVNRLRFRPPADQPYLPLVQSVPIVKHLQEAKLDVGLKRGVWANVVAKEKTTGGPVIGELSYFVYPKDWSANPEVPNAGTRYGEIYNNFIRIRPDGTFRLVVAPSRGIFALRPDAKRYPFPAEASTLKLPSYIHPSNYSAFAEVNPRLEDERISVEFVLQPGLSSHGKLVDQEGRPVVGAIASALGSDLFQVPDWSPLPTAEFTVQRMETNRPRLACFVHLGKKLAGSVVVQGVEKDAVQVPMVPWGTVIGRLVAADGKPIGNTQLEFRELWRRKQTDPMALDVGAYLAEPGTENRQQLLRTDEEGKFELPRLIPGLKYHLAAVDAKTSRTKGFVFKNLLVDPGQLKALGDLTLQSPPQE